jgi:hypothetical protein
MAQGTLPRLKCLDYCCEEKYPVAMIESLLDSETFDRYKRHMLSFEVNANPNLIYCPNAACDSAINLKEKPLKCSKCQTAVCPKCKLTAHPGSKCIA